MIPSHSIAGAFAKTLTLVLGAFAFVATDQVSAQSTKPTIILVHGAWADSSSWNGVITSLTHAGYVVYALPDPLRGLASDAATIATFLKTVPGPIILVGHSYGGAVISVASPGNSKIKALVYVDAFAPDGGDSCLSLLASAPPPPKDLFTPVRSLQLMAVTPIFISRQSITEQFSRPISRHRSPRSWR
jgi:pimeloyl-ACP methyl ester carboxylesterase